VQQPPRLVLCVKRTTLEDRRSLVRAAGLEYFAIGRR